MSDIKTNIKIGDTVKLMYWKDNKIHDFVVDDIFFEAYLGTNTVGYKIIITVKRQIKDNDGWTYWSTEKYFKNDFFNALAKAQEETT